MLPKRLSFPKKRDVLKSIFLIPRIFLEPLGLWPEQQTLWTKILFAIMLAACCTEEFGHVFYLIQNRKKIEEIPTTLISITTVFQAISKIVTLHVHAGTLKKLRWIVQNEFWPSDLFGEKVESDLNKLGRAASGIMIFVYTTAVIYFTGLFVIPLSIGDYNLPLKAAFGINFQFSPLFEILYFIQCLTNIFAVMHGIRGHDDFFVALTTNCIGQFKLLKEALSQIGTGNELKINSILDGIERGNPHGNKQDIKLLVRCIEHHKILLEFCDYIEIAFSASLCVQLFVSVAAICVSSFALIVVDLELTEMPGLFCYCSGHITQLFIFCVLGNEISHSTRAFAESVYGCDWQNKEHIELWKALQLIMLRANQRPKKITAMRIVTLNNTSFINVMRLSFSYHTLLSKLFERNR